MKKKFFSLQAKMTLAVIALGLLLAVIITTIGFLSSKDALETQYATRIRVAAQSAAGYITAEDIAEISAIDGDKSEAWARTFENLNRFREANEILYLYVNIPFESTMRVLIDTYIEGVDDLDFWMEYNTIFSYDDLSTNQTEYDEYAENYSLFLEGKGKVNPVIIDNEFGYTYGSSYPVLDENGNAVAMVNATISMQEVRDYLSDFLLLTATLSTLTILVLIVLFALFVRSAVVKPIVYLEKSTGKITEFKDEKINFSDYHTEVKTGDEIEELSNAFNYMLGQLDDYITNLQSVTAEKERIGTELNVATKIQSSMLPCIFPAFPDRKEFDIYATMLPAKEVGGDFYDFFLIDSDHLGMVMADVSGKGVPAALFMVIAKTLIKNNALYGKSPREIFETVNNQLCENNEANMFVTAFMGILDIKTGLFTYVNAGHNPPIIKRAGGKYEWLSTNPGFVLAGMDDMFYKQDEITLSCGDEIYMYTDGVTEAVNPQLELFTEPHLLNCINKYKDYSLKELLVSLKKDIDVFADGASQADDITMLVMRYTQK